jgi:uncharacterized ferritin-like protein (DUF455 family)
VRANGFDAAHAALMTCDPGEKCRLVAALAEAVSHEALSFDPVEARTSVTEVPVPGRPPRPELVPPAQLARRRLGSSLGRAALMHAVAHIEFNAINLALDAAYRFRDRPQAFYRDWVSVAADEARHFELVCEHLARLDHAYGDFPAHNGLWDMACKTADSCLVRMALVPRVLEARGLDVTPGMIARLERAGDHAAVAILRLILAEEERHVAIGSHWFAVCCAEAGLEPETTFIALLRERGRGVVRPPFNREARLRSGFGPAELDNLLAMDGIEAGL